MPCAGCSPGIAVHVGTTYKYWCAADGTYHWDWEPCGPQAPAPAPAPAPPTNGVSIMPLGGGTTLSLSAPPNAGTAMSGCCNCSKGAGSATAAPMNLATQAATVTAASPCGCGDCEKPEWLEILTAVVLVLLALAALQKQ